MIHQFLAALSPYAGRATAVLMCVVAANLWSAAAAQAPGAGISLSPAVVELKGSSGQAHRQTLSLTNSTQVPLAFELVAEDIVIDNGQRSFVPAGQRADSIAATALFSPQQIVVPPGKTATADVTVTVPPATSVRAVAAIFRGVTQVEVQAGVSMTGSVATLMTFTLSDNVRLEAADVEITPQTDTTNLSFVQEIRNVGSEPAVASGAIAVTDAAGRLITRIPVESQRLLPGERVRIVSDYPGQLSSGRYQAFLSLVYGSQLLSRNAGFDVASISDPPDAAAPLRAGGQ